MPDDNIIRPERPHEVTVPEGSYMAVAKTALPQEASVRKVLKEESGEEVEHISADKFVSDGSESLQGAPDRFVGDDDSNHREVSSRLPADHSRTDIRGADALPPAVQAKGASGLDLPPDYRNDVPTARMPAKLSGQGSVASPVSTPVTARGTPAPAQALASGSESVHAAQSEALMPPDMPEMDFPARVVHLHIQNENLRKRLDSLDADGHHHRPKKRSS